MTDCPPIDLATRLELEGALRHGAGRRDLLRWLGAAGMGAAFAGGLVTDAGRALAQTPHRGGRIRVAAQQSSTADTLDPVRGTNTTDYCRTFMFLNGLTRLDAQLVAQPELAVSWDDKDATVWTFKLRDGVTFHDGSKFTSADAVYSLNRVKDPRTGSVAKALAAQMTAIEPDGPLGLRITLQSPNADLPVLLGISQFLIVKDGTTDFSKGNGTGPFVCKEFSPGVRSVAVRNPNYWKPGRPYLDEIEYIGIEDETARVNAMMAGDIQVASQIGPRLVKRVKASPGYTVLVTPSGNYNDFVMRSGDPTLDANLVMAVKYLFDREQMASVLSGVVGNDQPLDPSSRWYNTELKQRAYDPDRAKSLWQKSGLGATALPLYTMAGSPMTDQAVILQQAAQGIGMNLELQRMPKDGYWSNVWTKKPFSVGNINPRPSPDVLFTLFFKSDSPFNETGWKSERFDSLLLQARGETDFAKRKPMYWEMQQLIHDQDTLGVPTFFPFLDAHTTKLKGLAPIATGGMMGFGFGENVWLEA